MKILLTGKPSIGKSTILQKFREIYSGELSGVITHEIRDSEHQRIGFEVSNFEGRKEILAHTQKVFSDVSISGFNVNITTINEFIVPELENVYQEKNKLLIIDEIGKMQALSGKFLKVIHHIIESETNFLGTIVYKPLEWSLAIKNDPRIILSEVTEQNRAQLPEILVTVFNSLSYFEKLMPKQKLTITTLLRDYFAHGEFTQINKLFNFAVPYIVENRWKKLSADDEIVTYEIQGNHNLHKTTLNKNTLEYHCDCALFLGKESYENEAGECSHIQVVKIVGNNEV